MGQIVTQKKKIKADKYNSTGGITQRESEASPPYINKATSQLKQKWKQQ